MDPKSYAWNYFAAHAAQRMSVFQFFISLSTAIVGGAVLIAGSAADRKWSALLFLMLPFLAFVFWRLDSRTSELIKNAEAALKWLESNSHDNGEDYFDPLALFTNDDKSTKSKSGRFFVGHFSYSVSFRYVFLATALLGLLGAAIALTSKHQQALAQPVISEALVQNPVIHRSPIQSVNGPGSRFDLPPGVAFKLEVAPVSSSTPLPNRIHKESADGK